MTSTRKFLNVSVDPALAEDSETSQAVSDIAALATSSPVTVSEKPKVANYRDGKSLLHLASKKGQVFDRCASMDRKYSCCGVHVLKSISNCPYDCQYCFLQDYLTNGTTAAVMDIDGMLAEVKEKMALHPGRFYRIGTWELGDSLALEDSIGQAQKLVPEFAKFDNAILELKTKSDCVEALLDLDHKERTVVSWSLNPAAIVRQVEHRTASIEDRISAMGRVQAAGYPIGLHFDPMLLYGDWREAYTELVQAVFSVVNPDRVAWVSIGSLRYNPEQKKKMEINFPKSILSTQEMQCGDDGKVRYVKPIRREMYQHLFADICRFGSPDLLVYLCMERWDIWEDVVGFSPESMEHMDFLFAQHLYHKFPGMLQTEPDLDSFLA